MNGWKGASPAKSENLIPSLLSKLLSNSNLGLKLQKPGPNRQLGTPF